VENLAHIRQICFGSNIEDLFAHSYQRSIAHKWVWVPRSRVMEAAQIGVPASEAEVRRLGEMLDKSNL